QEDVVVGSPIANRNRVEIEGLIGFFVNQLALRTNLAGNPTFLELLGRVREVALGAYAHQDVPFEKVVDELHPERNRNRSPLFQVEIVWLDIPSAGGELAGMKLRPVNIDTTCVYDLLLTVGGGDRLSGICTYSTEL